MKLSTNQSGAAEAWWAHNPQVPGSKPGSDKKRRLSAKYFLFSNFLIQIQYGLILDSDTIWVKCGPSCNYVRTWETP